MSTRSVLGLIYTTKGLREEGEDVDAVLAAHGIDLDRIDPNTRIERERELQIYAELARHLRNPLSGLRAGTHFAFAGYGPLVMLLMTAATAYESLQIGIRYQQLTFLFGTLSFEPGERCSALVLTPMPMPAPAFRSRVDGEMAGTFKLLRDMQAALGVNILPERIDLPYPAPPEARAYEEHFGCPVRFGEPVARLWMRNDYLQLRLPTADANAQAIYRALCDQQLAAQAAPTDTLADRVLRHLELFTESYPGAAEVARAFDMSERHFRRQLAEEGASFRDLLGRARQAKARQLLGNPRLSVEAVGQRLGYAETASFIHAFRRWEGCTPAAWRKRAGQAG